jgi:hypothetical protein
MSIKQSVQVSATGWRIGLGMPALGERGSSEDAGIRTIKTFILRAKSRSTIKKGQKLGRYEDKKKVNQKAQKCQSGVGPVVF